MISVVVELWEMQNKQSQILSSPEKYTECRILICVLFELCDTDYMKYLHEKVWTMISDLKNCIVRFFRSPMMD